MKKIIILLFVALSLFSACEDEADDKSKRDLLCEDDWKLNAWTASITYGGQTQILDLFTNPELMGIPECIIDDEVEYDSDGEYETKPETYSCESNISLFGNGEWGFKSEETILSMTVYGETSSMDYTIETLNEDNLVLIKIEPVNVTASRKILNISPNDTVDAISTMTFIH